jgi:hypothetical protein
MTEEQKTPAEAYADWIEEQEDIAPPLNPNAVDPDEDDADDIDDDEGESEEDSEETSDAEATEAEASSNSPDRGTETNTMSALRKMLLDEAAEDSEAGRRAKKALMAYDEEEPKDGEAQATPDDDSTEEARAETEPGDEPATEPDEDEKPKEGASAGGSLAMAARLQKVEAKLFKEELAKERSMLMASRPDFAPEVSAFLATQKIAVVRDACREPDKGGLPRGPGKGGSIGAARAALNVVHTVGEGAHDASSAAGQAASNMSGHGSKLDELMGIAPFKNPVVLEGNIQKLGVMTPEQARQVLKSGGAA